MGYNMEDSSFIATDVDTQKLPLIPAEDADEVLGKEPEKYDQEVLPVKNHQGPLVLQPQIITNVHRENEPPHVPKVEQCYYQINWPQAVLQRWATEKANREKNLNLVFNQVKKGDHQESAEMESPPQCSDD